MTTKVEKIVIYGDSDFAEQVYYQLESDDRYKVLAFTVDKERFTQNNCLGLPVYPFQDINVHFRNEEIKVFVAIGYSKMNSIRENVSNEVIQKGFKLLTYISKHAFIGQNVIIGDGCFICEFVSIKPGTVIEAGTIIFPNTSIGHSVKIEKYCYLSICIAVGGFSIIRNNCFLGMNSTIKNGITIAEKNIIGSASNVVRSTDPVGVYVGNPAKRMKDIELNNIRI